MKTESTALYVLKLGLILLAITAVVAALLGGGVLGGIAGMLIAVPTAALLKLQFDRHLQRLEDYKEKESVS